MRLLPSLLDRLAYCEDGNGGYRARAVSEQDIKDGLLRDLEWLLNTTRLDSVQSLDDYPQVQTSVLNFGIKSLAGRLVSATSEEAIAKSVREALERFEPRLRRVSVKGEMRAVANDRSMVLVIEAELLDRPVRKIQIQYELDLDDGVFSRQDLGRGDGAHT